MTDTMVREVRGVLALSHEEGGWKVPVLRTEAENGVGVDELARKIDEHRAFIEEQGTLAERRARNLRSEVLGIAASRMRRRLEATAEADPETQALLDRVVRRELDPASAASEILERQAGDE
jgi:LAO/AO transport system kinase